MSEHVPPDLHSNAAWTKRSYLPLGIDVAGLRCLVVGGGRVGARKALTLTAAGATVTVLSPKICQRLREPVEKGTIRWEQATYSRTCLDSFFLVVAATSDPALNVRISREAKDRNILFCVVSPGRLSRVIFPATHVQDGISVAVYSNGRDCSRSQKVRDEIAAMFRNRKDPPPQLVVFGIKGHTLPSDVFATLVRSTASLAPGDGPASEMLFLATCLRWECWFFAPSPRATIHDVLSLVQERTGILLESYRPVLYTRCGEKAFHHLLRMISGLDSLMRGETEIVGQVRSARARWIAERSSPLNQAFDRCLKSQKKLRHESGLSFLDSSWTGSVISLLEKHCAPLPRRRVLLFGCGRLGKAIASGLLETGAIVVPFSKRAESSGVAWCSRLGLTPGNPEVLEDFLTGSHALILTSDLAAAQVEAVRGHTRSHDLVVIDLTGSTGNLLEHPGRGCYYGLADISDVPLSGQNAARVAAAEQAAVTHTLTWYLSQSGSRQLERTIKIGGRTSRLSHIQIREVLDLLSLLSAGTTFEVITMEAPCDRDKNTPLPNVQTNDFFTRDLDEALLSGKIDLAVHSTKDLPTRIPDGLHVAAVTPAAAPWECLVTGSGESLADLPTEARVGTSSKRRQHQLAELRTDLLPCGVRGNVPERLAQLDEGKYEALILAAAGLIRLGFQKRISQIFSLKEFPPEPGQGSLSLMVREEDTELRALLGPLDLGDRKGLPWVLEKST